MWPLWCSLLSTILVNTSNQPLVNTWSRTLDLKHFSILKKCQSKLDCLINTSHKWNKWKVRIQCSTAYRSTRDNIVKEATSGPAFKKPHQKTEQTVVHRFDVIGDDYPSKGSFQFLEEDFDIHSSAILEQLRFLEDPRTSFQLQIFGRETCHVCTQLDHVFFSSRVHA